MGTYWENAFAKPVSLDERLKAMSREQVIAFAAGCAEHVLRHFVATFEAANVPEEFVSPFIVRCKVSQECCWSAVNGEADGQAIERAIRQLDELFEDDELLERAVDAGAHNIDQITAAVYRSLECVKHGGQSEYAVGAAHGAYSAVLQWYVLGEGETVEWTDEESETQQRGCQQCQQEIDFQNEYLSALEAIGAVPPSYDKIVSSMG